MNTIRDQIIGAWIPSAGPTGYSLLDRSGNGTHLTWTSPSATNWQANSRGGWCASTTDGGDFIATTRRIPATVAGFSVVHWLNARSYSGTANSMDANRGVYASGNVGPRLEFGAVAYWVYSSNTTTGGVLTVHDCGSSLVSLNDWGCYVLTHDGLTTSTTYQQGKPSGLTQSNVSGHSGAFVGSFGAMRLGQGSSDSGRGIDGLFGGTLIYSRPIAPAEVKWIFDQGPAMSWVMEPRRRLATYKAAAFRVYYATQRAQLIGGGLR